MANKNNEYYYLDLNLKTLKALDWGESNTATLTGDTDNPDAHRIFLTKGQFNKLKKKLS